MATEDEIRDAVRAARAAAGFRVNPARERHIQTLAGYCEELLAAVAAERERCVRVMKDVFRDGGFPGFGPLANAIRNHTGR